MCILRLVYINRSDSFLFQIDTTMFSIVSCGKLICEKHKCNNNYIK